MKKGLRLLFAIPLFRISLLPGGIGLLDSAAFIVWRWDKPPGNPGGSIGEMGWRVVAWEASGHIITFFGSMGMLLTGALYQKQPSENDAER